MRLRPSIEDGPGSSLIEMPAVESRFCGPTSRRRNDQVRRRKKALFGREQMMQAEGAVLDQKVGKVGLEALSQGLGFVAADRGGAQRMPADVRPAQYVMVNQNDPPYAGLRQRSADRCPDRPTTDQDNRCLKQAG
jgi:hypothetical protein